MITDTHASANSWDVEALQVKPCNHIIVTSIWDSYGFEFSVKKHWQCVRNMTRSDVPPPDIFLL